MADVYLARATGEAGFTKNIALKVLERSYARQPDMACAGNGPNRPADAQSVNGILYGGIAAKRAKANNVFGAINEAGGI